MDLSNKHSEKHSDTKHLDTTTLKQAEKLFN